MRAMAQRRPWNKRQTETQNDKVVRRIIRKFGSGNVDRQTMFGYNCLHVDSRQPETRSVSALLISELAEVVELVDTQR